MRRSLWRGCIFIIPMKKKDGAVWFGTLPSWATKSLPWLPLWCMHPHKARSNIYTTTFQYKIITDLNTSHGQTMQCSLIHLTPTVLQSFCLFFLLALSYMCNYWLWQLSHLQLATESSFQACLIQFWNHATNFHQSKPICSPSNTWRLFLWLLSGTIISCL